MARRTGLVLVQTGRFAEAEAACQEAVRLDPFSRAHVNLGEALRARNRSSPLKSPRMTRRPRP